MIKELCALFSGESKSQLAFPLALKTWIQPVLTDLPQLGEEQSLILGPSLLLSVIRFQPSLIFCTEN